MGQTNGEDVNEQKLDKIKFEILQLEDENSKTKYYSYPDMVDKIKRIIKDGADGKLV